MSTLWNTPAVPLHPLGVHQLVHDHMLLNDPKWPATVRKPSGYQPLNDALFDRLLNNDLTTQREMVDSINDFTRQQLRESNFARRIFPPIRISNDELDRSVATTPIAGGITRDTLSDAMMAMSMASFMSPTLGEPHRPLPTWEPEPPRQSPIIRYRPTLSLDAHQRRTSLSIGSSLLELHRHNQLMEREEALQALAAFRSHYRERRQMTFYQGFYHLHRSGQYDDVCAIFCLGGFNVQGMVEGRVQLGTCQVHATLDLNELPRDWRYDLVDQLNRRRFRDWPAALKSVAQNVSAQITAYVAADIRSCCCGSIPQATELPGIIDLNRDREAFMLEWYAYAEVGGTLNGPGRPYGQRQLRSDHERSESPTRYVGTDDEARGIGGAVGNTSGLDFIDFG